MGGKYKAYPEYKDSGVEWVGNIPSLWRIRKLKYNAPLVTEKADCKNFPIALENISSWTGEFIKSETVFEGAGVSFQKGDILFGKLRPYLAKVLLTESNGEAVGDFHVVRPRKIFGKYLQQVMLTEDFISIVDGSTFGAKMPRASWDFMANLRLPLPSLDEQTQIANFLDHETAKIDTLIEKQQELIKLLQEKRQAVISHAVTKGLNSDAPMKDSGVEWLGEVPEGWRIMKFTHCAQIRGGQVDPKISPFKELVLYAPNHIEKYTGKLLFEETARTQGADSGKYLCEKGDVIYSKIRPALCKVMLCPKELALCSADMYPIKGVNGLTNEFLFWLILTPEFTSAVILDSDRVAMPKINREKLGDYRLPVPPENEQRDIIRYLDSKMNSMEKIHIEANKVIKLLQERRTALISAAVTGKIDVRDWQK